MPEQRSTEATERQAGREAFAGPLYKILSRTDAKEADTNITGVALTKALAPYFSAPDRPYPSQTFIEVIILNQEGAEPIPFYRGRVTIQVQDRRKGRIETFISGINDLRSISSAGDIMLFEPSLDQSGLYRITRVSMNSPRYASLKARTGRTTAGLLSGGQRPPRYEQSSTPPPPVEKRQRMLRPLDVDGQVIQADFSVAGEWPDFEVTFASGDGHGRNSEYAAGVEQVLLNAAGLGARLMSARISSSRVDRNEASGAPEGFFVPDGLDMPLELAAQDDFRILRLALVRTGARVRSKPGGSGNTTRRMTLAMELPTPQRTAADLGVLLQGGKTGVSDITLDLLNSLTSIDASWVRWIASLDEGSRGFSGGKRWLNAEAVMYRPHPSRKRSGATDIELGVRPSGRPWTVEINAPRTPDDEMGLASIARSADGRLFLIRQGRLGANVDSDGRILEATFRALSDLTPVRVRGGNARSPRDWYIVAELDASPEVIRAQTGDFVRACARVRSRSRGVPDFLPPAPPLYAAPETGGTARRKATPARPAADFVLVHGEVSLRLSALLEQAGLFLLKDRHEVGYAVDGTILAPGGPILLEIKTGTTAADVYEGVGQLMLYAEMLKLPTHRKVLLIPAVPSTALTEAVKACGIVLHHFDLEVVDGTTIIDFPQDFLALFGLGREPD